MIGIARSLPFKTGITEEGSGGQEQVMLGKCLAMCPNEMCWQSQGRGG